MSKENIQTKVNFHFEGESRPFASTEDFETLKRFLYIKESSEHETDIKEVIVEGETFLISSVQLSILKETSTLHIEYGIDLALSGEPRPYNFRVTVYLRKK